MFRMKGRLLASALCVMLAAAMIVPAAAHGCHGGRSRHGGFRQKVQTTVTVCPYDDCTLTGRHTHDGVIYCGYCHDSGVCDNNCRALCPLEDCTELGRHTHGYTTYCGYAHTGGYCDGTCRELCPYEDCGETGYHYHNQMPYCGYGHENGFCDGSCQTQACYGCGHHGGR